MNILETISLVSSGFVFGVLAFAVVTYFKNQKEIDFLDKKDASIERLHEQNATLKQLVLEQRNLIDKLNKIIADRKQT